MEPTGRRLGTATIHLSQLLLQPGIRAPYRNCGAKSATSCFEFPLFFGASAEDQMMTWYRIKLGVSHGTTLDMDALHVLIGTLALFLFAALMRRSIADRWPWLTILAAELLNEWNDLRVERWPDLGVQMGEGAKDVLLTMALPTLLLFVARYRPTMLLSTRPPDRDNQP